MCNAAFVGLRKKTLSPTHRAASLFLIPSVGHPKHHAYGAYKQSVKIKNRITMELQPLIDNIPLFIEHISGQIWAGMIFVGAMFFKQLREKLDSLLTQAMSAILDGIADYARTSVLLRHSDSLFKRRYHKHLSYEHRVFNVRGLRTVGAVTLELEKVFVELRIAPSHSPQQAPHDLLARQELQGHQPIWAFLRSKQCDRRDVFSYNGCSVYQMWRKQHCRLFHRSHPPSQKLRLAIIGAPGCGKTTLMQHTVLILATGQQCQYGLASYTPLLLFLRQHIQAIISDEPPTLATLAQTHFANSQEYPKLHPPQDWFERQLDSGRCLVMLDGLDEVAHQDERKQVSAWVDQQILTYPECHFLITSRPQGYKEAPLARTNVLEVQSFSMAQVCRFVDNWYLATETMSSNKLDDGVRALARKNAQNLLKRLNEHPKLSALTVNPLLLTMIAMVHRYRGQLPGRRVELYSEICDVLLGHWQASKGMQTDLTPAQNREVLEPLAAYMMDKQMREIDTQTCAAILTPSLHEVGVVVQNNEALRHYLNEVQAGSGLLLEGQMDTWRFAHLTFQKYLCAAHFSAVGWVERSETHNFGV